MRGYKAFYPDMTCRPVGSDPFLYEVGKEYALPEGSPLVLCKSGFHFCQDMYFVYRWYPENFTTRVCEVDALGKVLFDKIPDKCVTDRIRIIRELTPKEIILWILTSAFSRRLLSKLEHSVMGAYSASAFFAAYPSAFISERRAAFREALKMKGGEGK